MTAQRPAEDRSMADAAERQHFGHAVCEGRDGIVRSVGRIRRLAMPRQVERQQLVPLGKAAGELPFKHLARGP